VLAYIARRLLIMIPILILISIVSFALIELPPGDWVTMRIESLKMQGMGVSDQEAARLTLQFGLDQPVYMRYANWVKGIITRRDFGWSLQYNRPVNQILRERIPITVLISLLSLVFSWSLAIPIGVYSATHQYSPADYFFTFIGFMGMATPGFLLALVLAWLLVNFVGFSPLGLFSTEYMSAPWSSAKVLDLLKHLVLPLVLVGLANTGGTIRVMRANLLDEIHKQYVTTARAKGLAELKILFRYPVRVAINPILSTMGWVLPGLVSGELLIAIVLNLQTTGPVLLGAVMVQDMYLAGSIVLVLSSLTVFGALLSDVLLAFLDPRIRFGGVAK